MRKNALISLILWILIVTFVTLVLTGTLISKNTGKTRTFTKAICDHNNYCEDFIIKCEGKKIISISPISGAATKYPISWLDPRAIEEAGIVCS